MASPGGRVTGWISPCSRAAAVHVASTTAEIAAKVVKGAVPGAVVLLHLGGWHTYDALPSMVLRLRSAGLQPTTLTDLLR